MRVRSIGGREDDLHYDQLIVALGSTSRTLPIPGLAEHAIGFKTLAEAIALRNRLVQTLEQAEIEPDEAVRRALLTYVFVGAGYAGLEGVAELQDFAADLVQRYPRARLQGLRFLLVEAQGPGHDRDPARPRGVRERRAAPARDRDPHLDDDRARRRRSRSSSRAARSSRRAPSSGRRASSRTRSWRSSGCRSDGGGRIAADRFCAVPGRPGVWAIGDAAGGAGPGQQGRTRRRRRRSTCCARPRSPPTTSAHALAGEPQRRRPFRYRTLGVFVDMGRHQAVASTLGIKWRGFPAWFLARTYHLALMPGTARRARLVTDWTAGLLFGRDSAELGQLGHPPGLEATSAGGTGASEARGDEVVGGAGVRLDD